MTKVYVESVGAIIDGRPVGSSFELEERSAERLVALGYVKYVVKEPTQEVPVKKESAPKKPATKAKATKTTKTTKE